MEHQARPAATPNLPAPAGPLPSPQTVGKAAGAVALGVAGAALMGALAVDVTEVAIAGACELWSQWGADRRSSGAL